MFDTTVEKRKLLVGRIAQAIGVPATEFTTSKTSDLAQTIELLRLWCAVTNVHDREKFLDHVRAFEAIPTARRLV